MTAKQQRDVALRALKRRLSGLRAELSQLLAPDDARWYRFGFKRPSDGRMPQEVSGVKVAEGGPGEVHVEWNSASRASSYRVAWKASDSEGEPTDAGIFGDTATTLRKLPEGVTLTIRVSARNRAGETRGQEVRILVLKREASVESDRSAAPASLPWLANER